MKIVRMGKKCIVYLLTVFCVLSCLYVPVGKAYAAEGDSSSVGFGTYSADVEQFPKSYRAGLYALKALHPNWTFVMLDTGLDWNAALDAEMGNKSWMPNSKPAWMKGDTINSGWSYASRDGLAFYMDPRNSLSEDYIFQFEQLNFNENCHSIDALDLFLEKTFMTKANKAPGMDLTFAQIFYWLGRYYNVSPYHLAARVYQEQGAKGTSPLISGTYPGYEGYYNYFNIKASGSTDKAVIESGLAHAKSQEWTNAYKSIEGGTIFVGEKYITKGQYTLYLQKFNVNPSGSYSVYNHQYMQNVLASKSEGLTTKKLYANAGALNSDFVFVIPVYRNMPATACGEPGTTVTEPVLPSATVLKATMDLKNAASITFTLNPDNKGSINRITVNGNDTAFTENTDGTVSVTCPIAVRHFGDSMELRLYNGSGETIYFDNEQTMETYTYSALEYLNAIAGSGAAADSQNVQLAQALIKYNAFAALYFDGVATTESIPDVNTAKLHTTAPATETAEGVTYLGTSLLVSDGIVLRHYFEGLPEEAVCRGEQISKKGEVFCVDTRLTPCELDETVTVQITCGEETVAAVSYCPEYYLYQILEESNDIKLLKLVWSLCNYELKCNE